MLILLLECRLNFVGALHRSPFEMQKSSSCKIIFKKKKKNQKGKKRVGIAVDTLVCDIWRFGIKLSFLMGNNKKHLLG